MVAPVSPYLLGFYLTKGKVFCCTWLFSRLW